MISGNYKKCEEFDPQVILSDDTHCFFVFCKNLKNLLCSSMFCIRTNINKLMWFVKKLIIALVKCLNYKAVLLNFHKCKHARKLLLINNVVVTPCFVSFAFWQKDTSPITGNLRETRVSIYRQSSIKIPLSKTSSNPYFTSFHIKPPPDRE